MNVAILGLGEVGAAIKKLTKKKHTVFVRELEYDETKGKQVDILHVCIPYSDSFKTIVTEVINDLNPDLVIINSTVKPGTTNALYQQVKTNMVHAPIDGVHPNLYEYLFKFTKPLGPVNKESYQSTKAHFEELGVKTKRFDSPLETELAKILSTTYYGWNILFEKWVHNLSREHQANYKQVYKTYNEIYNAGYAKDLPHVVRPVLKHYRGEIGGHCVIPNANIMNDWLKDDFTTFLLKQNEKLADESN